MTKKDLSKPSAAIPENPVSKLEKKPSSATKKSGNEIDEIFSGKKRKKTQQKKAEKPAGDDAGKQEKMKKKKKKKKSEEDGFMDPPSRPRKKTNDGLALYTEEELEIGRADAGGTPLCPFDCSCCF
ncbi:hypothetical protein NMG60_11000791 [Bertholletia excelsa]